MTSTTNPDFSEHLNNFYNNNPFVQLLGIQLKKSNLDRLLYL